MKVNWFEFEQYFEKRGPNKIQEGKAFPLPGELRAETGGRLYCTWLIKEVYPVW
jgi:hypothetical protein